MLIIGCDFHPGFQQVAIFDNQTGEIIEKKLHHPAEAIGFYRGLEGEVRVGLEAGSPCQWFRRLLQDAHPGSRDAAAEDRPARCGADFKADAGRPVSAHLGTD